MTLSVSATVPAYVPDALTSQTVVAVSQPQQSGPLVPVAHVKPVSAAKPSVLTGRVTEKTSLVAITLQNGSLSKIAANKHLPIEILEKIVREVARDFPPAVLENLKCVSLTDTTLNKLVTRNAIGRHRKILGKLMQSFETQTFPLIVNPDTVKFLTMMSYKSRKAFAITATYSLESRQKYYLMRGLGSRLEYFEQAEQTALVNTVCSLSVEEGRANVIGKTAESVSYLPPTLQDALIRTSLAMIDPANKAFCIRTLSRQFAHLNTSQRELLFQAALDFSCGEQKGFALLGACLRLEQLGSIQREQLIEAVYALDDSHGRYAAFTGLASSVKDLDGARKKQLVETICNFETEEQRRIAISGFRSRLAYLDAPARARLVDTIRNMAQRGTKHTAIQTMCKDFHHLQPEHISSLVQDVLNDSIPESMTLRHLGSSLQHIAPADRQKIMSAIERLQDPWQRANALGGLCKGAAHLTEDQRATLIKCALAFTDSAIRCKAISGMGGALNSLSPAQHNRLIDAALLVNESGPRFEAITGLSEGFSSLQPEQYDRLVDQVLSEPDGPPKLNAIASLVFNAQLPEW